MTMTAEKQTDERAIDQARAQLSSIEDMVERLEHAQECTEGDCKKGAEGGDTWDDAEQYHDEDTARQTIKEDALSVEVRTGWHTPAAQEKPDEYMILLCTDRPAVRITGGLSEYFKPDSAGLQYRDSFTPWEFCPITSDQEQTLLTFAGCFYFEE